MPYNRIIIIGSGGAGKSTLARKLAEKLNLPLYHLDKIHWLPGWKAISRDEFVRKQHEIFKEERWIIDGNYISTMAMRAEEADTIIFLDFNMFVCLKGVLKRYFSKEKRQDVAEGCKENLHLQFLYWIVTFRFHTKPKIKSILEQYKDRKKIFVLRKREEINIFFNN
ncbi:MAG: hypothetical protein K1X86_14335 [Ignavibacteria bacterium]|nr:hypothetical protein [Ignavibacteria bacterium]